MNFSFVTSTLKLKVRSCGFEFQFMNFIFKILTLKLHILILLFKNFSLGISVWEMLGLSLRLSNSISGVSVLKFYF